RPSSTGWSPDAMIFRSLALGACLLSACVSAVLAAQPAPAAADEPPHLVERVETGALPPASERLPADAQTVPTGFGADPAARYGCKLYLLMGSAKDTRQIYVYGYARLVGYDVNLQLVPDLLAAVDVEEDRIFTLRLRRGHRWSDGHPFTSADFRYWWEDVANHPDLSPGGPPVDLIVDGEKP